MSKFCMNCGNELPDIAKFCPKCGASAEVPACPACGGEVDLNQAFCIHCGANLKETPAPEAPSEPASAKTPAKAPEGWQKPSFAPAPEAPKEAPPAPEPPPRKKVEPPPVCPRCGKQTVPGYEHCVYCGTYWSPEDKPEPKKSAAKPAKPQPRQTAPDPSGTWRDISWTYRRAVMRWSVRMEIHAEVDDKQLRCTSSSKFFGQTDVAEEKMDLESISKITLVSRASFMVWTAISMLLTVFVAMLVLPMFGVSLAISGAELILTAILLAGMCALMVWWVRFNLYHHRMIITGTGESGQKEIVLEALKPTPLKELQAELTGRTGVQLPRQNESTGEFKAIVGAIVGIGLGIALTIFVVGQMPQTAQGSSTERRTSSGTVPSQTQAPAQDSGWESVNKRLGYDVTELFGTWKETSYDYRNDMYASLTISENRDGGIDVCYVYPMANEYSGFMSIDDEDDPYSYMTSAYGTSGTTFWFFYDGYGISVLEYSDDGSTDEMYFEPI